jgi:hypothetical protein
MRVTRPSASAVPCGMQRWWRQGGAEVVVVTRRRRAGRGEAVCALVVAGSGDGGVLAGRMLWCNPPRELCARARHAPLRCAVLRSEIIAALGGGGDGGVCVCWYAMVHGRRVLWSLDLGPCAAPVCSRRRTEERDPRRDTCRERCRVAWCVCARRALSRPRGSGWHVCELKRKRGFCQLPAFAFDRRKAVCGEVQDVHPADPPRPRLMQG